MGDIGAPELLIILAVVLLLFGGSRLAGLGKSAGRALREFKDETKDLAPAPSAVAAPPVGAPPLVAPAQAPAAPTTTPPPAERPV